ncbi:MAG: DUF533 domain-containing protein [Acidobacteriota bacterium]
MGFLDRMISDLIQDNTGINARRLVRKIGGGKILAMGGAAIAASVMAEKHGMLGQKGAAPAAGAAPAGAAPAGHTPAGHAPAQAAPPPPVPGAAAAPPPPPIPGAPPAAAPPPPPPVQGAATEAAAPAGDEADIELPQETTYAVVRTMVAAALADGNLAPEEKAIIQKHLGESGLSEEQTRQIHQDLVLPPSLDELATLASDAESREILFRFAALVVLADQQVSDLERAWLDRLASTFGIEGERKAALEADIFG